MCPQTLLKVCGDAYVTLGGDGKALEKVNIFHPFALRMYSVSWPKKTIVPLAYSAEAATSAAKAGRQDVPLRRGSGGRFGGHPSLRKGGPSQHIAAKRVACHP